MNQKQRNRNRPAARGVHCTNQQQQQPGHEQQDAELPDWFQPVFVALNVYVRTGELTAPLAHIPQVIYHDEVNKTILVRHIYEGEQLNFFIGLPLTAQQIEAADKEWIDAETNALEGN